MPKHPITTPETFALRQPVLESMSALKGRWHVVDDGKWLDVDLPLTNYSPHERAIIEFALNPLVTAENIFGGLDRPIQQALATAIHKIFA